MHGVDAVISFLGHALVHPGGRERGRRWEGGSVVGKCNNGHHDKATSSFVWKSLRSLVARTAMVTRAPTRPTMPKAVKNIPSSQNWTVLKVCNVIESEKEVASEGADR